MTLGTQKGTLTLTTTPVFSPQRWSPGLLNHGRVESSGFSLRLDVWALSMGP